jgi:hypothetical protein
VSIFKPKKTAPRSLIKYTIQDDIKLIKPKHILLQDVKLEFLNWLIGSIINKDEMEKLKKREKAPLMKNIKQEKKQHEICRLYILD